MKKLSNINEDILTDIIMRDKKGEVRKEDKDNIDKIKPIDFGKDFPVYIADIDYMEGGEDHFDWYRAMEINDKIKKSGWRLPFGFDEICNLFLKDRYYPEELKKTLKQNKDYDNFKASLTSDETGETILFELDNSNGFPITYYWCNWEANREDEIKLKNARAFVVGDSGLSKNVISHNNCEKTRLNKIRLLKDK